MGIAGGLVGWIIAAAAVLESSRFPQGPEQLDECRKLIVRVQTGSGWGYPDLGPFEGLG